MAVGDDRKREGRERERERKSVEQYMVGRSARRGEVGSAVCSCRSSGVGYVVRLSVAFASRDLTRAFVLSYKRAVAARTNKR